MALTPIQKSLATAMLITRPTLPDVTDVLNVVRTIPEEAAAKACNNMGWPVITHRADQEMTKDPRIRFTGILQHIETTLVMRDHTAQILVIKHHPEPNEPMWIDGQCSCGWEIDEYLEHDESGREEARDQINEHLKAVFNGTWED